VAGARLVGGSGVTRPVNARPGRPDDGVRVGEDPRLRPASAIRPAVPGNRNAGSGGMRYFGGAGSLVLG
jgi:hypothetical protein